MLHNTGELPLAIIMRGLPGSGKSWWARAVCDQHLGYLENNDRYAGICSTDSYFYIGGEYCFDATLLSEHHDSNQLQFKKLLNSDWPLVVCDNTNMRLWELRPYIDAALSHGYCVKVVEIGLPVRPFWIRLFTKRNLHGVPIKLMQRMANAYEAYPGCTAVQTIRETPYIE